MQSSYVTRAGAVRNTFANWETLGSYWRAWRQTRAAIPSPGIAGYSTILLAVLLTAILQSLSAEILDNRAQFLIFIPAVMTAAFLGGFRAGALVTMLCLATTLDAFGETEGGDLPLLFHAAAFGVVALGLSIFGDNMRRRAGGTGLAQQEAHLASLIDAMPGAMLVFDDAGTLRKLNRAAEHLFGFGADEILGRNAGFLIETEGKFPCPTKVTTKCRVLGLRKDGSRFPAEMLLSATVIEGRRYYTGLAVDLTERESTQARLAALQGEMIHASRLSLMGTMASAMAHELNQPLSAISNYLKGLKHAAARDGDERSPALSAILDKTADQALRAGQIIGRLRDLVARGETERRLESLDMLVEEASALALPGIRERGIRVTFQHAAQGERVLVDRVQIQQVLLNLIRNAGEAMAEAERRELTISTTTAGAALLTIRLEDSGHGVADGLLPRLFEPFATTKRDGMGIGLSISRLIIEAHGGKLWYEAAPGGGAAFSFTLPRIAQHELDHAA